MDPIRIRFSIVKRNLNNKSRLLRIASLFLCFLGIYTFGPSSYNTAQAEIPPTPARTDVSIIIDEYNIEITAPVSPGKYTFQVKNIGTMFHEVIIFKLNEGITVDKFKSVISEGGSLRKVGKLRNNMPPIEYGTTGSLTSTLDAGNYLLLCFRVDKKSGNPHFMMGMLHEFTVQ